MNNLVTIGAQAVAVKEYRGQRVVTFRDIDRVHGRPHNTARRNFNANKKHFESGRDFYEIKRGDPMYEIRTLAVPPKGITLITESGYMMLAKSFTDDLAWELQRTLVDCYFHGNTKPAPEPPKQIEPPYEYVPKFWRGRQVVTLKDIEKLTGVREEAAGSALLRHRKEIRATDGCLLTGEELRTFKAEQHLNWRVAQLWVLTKRGMEKLARWMSRTEQSLALDVWKGAAPVAKLPAPVEEKGTYLCVDVPENREAQKCIEDLRKALTAMDVTLTLFSTYAAPDDSDAMKRMLKLQAMQIFERACYVNHNLKIETVRKHI